MLSNAQILALKPAAKDYKKADGNGLALIVKPTGSLLWRLKYRFHGLERSMAFGRYPQVTLKRAREKCAEARALLEHGIDPMAVRRQDKIDAKLAAGATFRVVADDYVAKMEREGKKPATLKKARYFVDALQASIGRRPIAEIGPHELLGALKKVEARGHYETALRLRSFASRVFRFGVATLRTEHDPAQVLRGALTTPRVRHHSAILEPRRVGELMRAIRGYSGRVETRIALDLIAHVFLRPGELRKAEWQEIDFAHAVWRIPGERMKMGRPHVVPLSSQSLDLLMRLRALDNVGPFLFPAFHTSLRPMSENTINAALRRLGYDGSQMTSHGFRATASTLLNESGRWHPDAIERALAHSDPDNVRAAYHRGSHWNERVVMAQWWSDYLDHLRDRRDAPRLTRSQAIPDNIVFDDPRLPGFGQPRQRSRPRTGSKADPDGVLRIGTHGIVSAL